MNLRAIVYRIVSDFLSISRSDWDVSGEDADTSGPRVSVTRGQPVSRSTDCLDLDVACSGVTRDTCNARARDETPRNMRKYQGVIRLALNSSASSCNVSHVSHSDVSHVSHVSHSDLSTLDLVNITGEAEQSQEMGDTSLSSNAYYTLDTRRLASKHKKNQHDR